MALWERIKRFSRSVVILALSCLVLEQVWYSVVVPGYFLGVLVSPVFWGLFSTVCFSLLWRFDQGYIKKKSYSEKKSIWKPVFNYDDKGLWDISDATHPITGLPMFGCIDSHGNPY